MFIRFGSYSILAIILLTEICMSEKLIEHKNKTIQIIPRIVNGYNVKAGQFPYQVSLRRVHRINGGSNHSMHYCGGSLISDRWIISAAHCAKDRALNDSILKNVVVVGAQHLYNDGIWYNIEKVIIHPDSGIEKNDLSLVRTQKRVFFNRHIQPIPIGKYDPVYNDIAVISGWGDNQVRNLFFCFIL